MRPRVSSALRGPRRLVGLTMRLFPSRPRFRLQRVSGRTLPSPKTRVSDLERPRRVFPRFERHSHNGVVLPQAVMPVRSPTEVSYKTPTLIQSAKNPDDTAIM